MSYGIQPPEVFTVKEIFLTLQGEGAQAGKPAVFCRFSGCNLWTGREKDRAKSVCQFCDTDFVGGSKYEEADLVRAIVSAWGSGTQNRMVVLTGGEPTLQVTKDLIAQLRGHGFKVAIETNGTNFLDRFDVDWLCVSPKQQHIEIKGGHELKLAFPQPDVQPFLFEHLKFDHFSLQPIDGPKRDENTRAAIDYCLRHPQWRLSLQTHKYVGIR